MMDLITQLWAFISGWASMANPAKVSGAIMLLISIWKSSLIQPLWAKLGNFQVLVAPILGIGLAISQLPGGFSLANLWAGLQAGGLAIAFHELLTVLESVPWIGAKYQAIIAFFDNLLYKPAVVSAAKVAVAQKK